MDEYPTWKVEMMMFLEATDCDYLDRIQYGPYVPRKIIPTPLIDGVDQPKYYCVNDNSE